MNSRPVWLYIIPNQPELHNETILRRKEEERKEKLKTKKAEYVVEC